ncbi:hypothetical protein FHS24_001865 [Psychrobacter luti]|uniref:Uncharacterized protein n=1 Tax=Psychrobacter luti TaxID=198481 RepID=A0A839TE22_9GAMM|nr:hypothetical protein [Psychrobacter luti]MBB3107340.1 hypothetical protein [Psychrobacter luti]
MRLPGINDLIQDLQLAKQIAIEDRNPNALIMATVSQAKLLGLDKPIIKDVNADAVQSISDLMNELANDDQLLPKRISHAQDEY